MLNKFYTEDGVYVDQTDTEVSPRVGVNAIVELRGIPYYIMCINYDNANNVGDAVQERWFYVKKVEKIQSIKTTR